MSGIRIVVAGAGGGMGQAAIRAISQSPDCTPARALESKTHPDIGADAGTLAGLKPLGVALASDAASLLSKADALIDFTVPKVAVELSALAAQLRVVHVIGTTGFSPGDETMIRETANRTA